MELLAWIVGLSAVAWFIAGIWNGTRLTDATIETTRKLGKVVNTSDTFSITDNTAGVTPFEIKTAVRRR